MHIYNIYICNYAYMSIYPYFKKNNVDNIIILFIKLYKYNKYILTYILYKMKYIYFHIK